MIILSDQIVWIMDLEEVLNRPGSRTQRACIEKRGFFTLNKLKTHNADKKNVKSFREQFIVLLYTISDMLL